MVRVLCISLIPGGGALNPALKRLGFKVYDMQSCFLSRIDPLKWARIVRNREHYDPKMLKDYEAAVGIPTSSCWERIYRAEPDYLKVILVVEADKQRWAQTVIREGLPVIAEVERIGKRSRVGRDWIAFFTSMYPREVIAPTDPGTSFAPVAARLSPATESTPKRDSPSGEDSVVKEVGEREAEVIQEALSARSDSSTVNHQSPAPSPPTQAAVGAPVSQTPAPSLAGVVHSLSADGGGNSDSPSSTVSSLSPASAEELEMMQIMAEGLSNFETNVQQTVPKHRLLVYQREEGWGPLCEFLELPTPRIRTESGEEEEEPFPPHSDGTEMLRAFRVRLARAGTASRLLTYTLGFIMLIQVTPLIWAQGIQVPEWITELKRDYDLAYGQTLPLPNFRPKQPTTTTVG